jgi:predicted amidophosphoribosyltransferase
VVGRVDALKFLYKIYSGFDGFTPDRVPDRLTSGGRLKLGWTRYLDQVEIDDEIWVYFKGRGVPAGGVYVKGQVDRVDRSGYAVFASIGDYSPSRPLERSTALDETVRPRGLQAFLLPEKWRTAVDCSIDMAATSCKGRQCRDCATWAGLPLIDPSTCRAPERLDGAVVERFVAAYWVIPRRAFVYYQARPVRRGVVKSSEVFMRFKVGLQNLAYPLALGINSALGQNRPTSFDAIIPVPLSPEKIERGELHRTLVLSKELGRLSRVQVSECLALTMPIGKRRLGAPDPAYFEAQYLKCLELVAPLPDRGRVLIVDDVCTKGSTLRTCATFLRRHYPSLSISVAAAGLMVRRPVVIHDDAVLEGH